MLEKDYDFDSRRDYINNKNNSFATLITPCFMVQMTTLVVVAAASYHWL